MKTQFYSPLQMSAHWSRTLNLNTIIYKTKWAQSPDLLVLFGVEHIYKGV